MFRRSNALLVACFLLAGCGIQVRTPSAPPAPETVTATASAPPHLNPVLPPPPVDPLVLEPGQTVVTLSFDDGSNARAAQIMNAYGLRGTFYINSGNAGKPGYLSVADLNWIATNSGNEIAGNTVSHPDLSTLNADQIRREICDDRATLMGWGFPVRNFAYPFGYVTAKIEQIVASCGYNSAMSVGEVRTVHLPEDSTPEESCAQCDWAETVPPRDPFRTRAPAQVHSNWTVEEFQQQIAEAQNSGGGWVQFTFHGICPSDCTDLSTAEPAFTELMTWLADQQLQGNLLVRTVGEVIGGSVQPAPLGPHS